MSSSISFDISSAQRQTALAPGKSNDDAAAVLRKFLNPALKGKGWNAFIAALAAGDQKNWDNSRLAFDQLTITGASGVYLDRRAGDQGETRPSAVGMSDELFRRLSIIKKTNKLTQEAFLEVLEVFYGSDAVRASSTTTASEPFPLIDQDTLLLLLDERVTVQVTFQRSEFGQIGQATALEVAGAISRALDEAGTQGYAQAYTDPNSGSTSVRVYSGSLGLGSSVRIIGGSGQRALQFPTPLFKAEAFLPTTWVVTKGSQPGHVIFTGGAGVFDLDLVRAGDLVYIFSNDPSDPFAIAGLQGVFPISDVTTYYLVESSAAPRQQYFDILLPNAPLGTYPQTEFTSLMFFRPTRRTIYDQPRRVVVTQSGRVSLPATTQVVSRKPGTGAYLNGNNSFAISSLVRTPDNVVTVSTSANHGLAAGDQIQLDSIRPTGDHPAVTPGTPSGNYVSNLANGTTDASLATTLSTAATFSGTEHRVVRLQDGTLFIAGGMTVTGGGVTTTPITHPTVFQILSETVLSDGSRQQTYQWKSLATHTTTTGARAFGASAMSDGRVLVTGGGNGADFSAANGNWDVFDYGTSPVVDTQTSGTLLLARGGHGQCSLPNNTVFICGGWNTSGPLSSSALFTGSTMTWASKASMRFARFDHGLAATSATTLIAIGGKTAFKSLNSCEIYDTGSNTWTSTGSMTYARYGFATVVLPDNRVVVIGGQGYNPTQSTSVTALNSCEIYNPNTGLWATASPMRDSRDYPVAVYVPTRNAIFVLGGTGVQTLEMLDLSTMKWTRSLASIPNTISSRPLVQSAGALAGTDTVLLTGGTDAGDTQPFNYIIIPGAEKLWKGGLNQQAAVAAVSSPTKFTIKLPSNSIDTYVAADAGALMTPLKANPAPVGVPGPFSYDVKAGLSVTSVVAKLGSQINSNQSYSTLSLDTTSDSQPALAFPDAVGYLVFDFGFAGQVGPIKYLGCFDDTDLLLDASVKFPKTIPAGVTVTLLKSNSPFVPAAAQAVKLGNFYVTGSAAGRVAAEAALNDIAAAGVDVSMTIVYPGDRGLGNEGRPTSGTSKLSDAVAVWGGDDLDNEIPADREGS